LARRTQSTFIRAPDLIRWDVGSDEAGAVYRGCRLVLSRPDQHIAWCGNALPRNPDALIDLVHGRQEGRS